MVIDLSPAMSVAATACAFVGFLAITFAVVYLSWSFVLALSASISFTTCMLSYAFKNPTPIDRPLRWWEVHWYALPWRVLRTGVRFWWTGVPTDKGGRNKHGGGYRWRGVGDWWTWAPRETESQS